MDNLSKDDIDYIFKKGTDKQEFSFKESAWDNMESMLDAEDDKKRIFYKRFLLPGLLLLSITSAGVYTYFSSKTESIKLPKVEIAIDNTILNNANALETYTPTKEFTAEENETTIANTESNENNAKKSNTRISDVKETSYTNSSKISKKSTPTKTVNTKTNLSTNTFQSITPIRSIPKNSITSTEINAVSALISVVAKSTDELTGAKVIRNNSAISNLPRLTLQSLNNELRKVEAKPLIVASTAKNNDLTYSVILGKEWSSVGMMNKLDGGFRIGAEIGYQFKNRFKVSTGIVYSKKHYETEGTNYTPAAQFRWVDNVAPETVNGTCDVIEIPLEFTYYFKNYKQSSFYISGGASTYIMTNEWYDFKFSDPNYENDPSVPKFSTTQNSKKCIHAFGIGTLSVGYQKRINKNLALQVAPYVQIPFTGIGMGGVNLISSGVQVKLNFAK